MPLAILAMFAASLIAVFQTDLKRLLAYSSVAQVGYMILGIGLATKISLSATIVHLFNHGITKAVLFMVVGAFVMQKGSSFTKNLNGLGKQMPWTCAAFVIGGLSLIGVPGTAGFISKWLLIDAALKVDLWWLAILIVMSSLLAVIYVWKTVEVLYMTEPDEGSDVKESPMSMLIPMWIMAIACIYFGLNTEITLTSASVAANSLLGGGVQ